MTSRKSDKPSSESMSEIRESLKVGKFPELRSITESGIEVLARLLDTNKRIARQKDEVA